MLWRSAKIQGTQLSDNFRYCIGKLANWQIVATNRFQKSLLLAAQAALEVMLVIDFFQTLLV